MNEPSLVDQLYPLSYSRPLIYPFKYFIRKKYQTFASSCQKKNNLFLFCDYRFGFLASPYEDLTTCLWFQVLIIDDLIINDVLDVP